MTKTRLHFQPIRGKALDIIDAILQTREVTSTGRTFRVVRMVTEEVVVNIVDYAYPAGTTPPGADYIDVEIERDEEQITLRFRDGGIPFNPLTVKAPDTTLTSEERKVGGLGIFLVLNMMDSVKYEYTDGENVLTVTKNVKSEE